jgi:lipoprotein-releasing system ATP-binding protein
MPPISILKTIDLHKSYPTGAFSELHVLKGIDFEAFEGEIITIVGHSGVGKSTFLHLIGALDRPTSGRIELDGQDISHYDEAKLAHFRNRTIGFVFQAHHLLPEFTALENVMMPGLIAGQNGSELKKRSVELLTSVGLKERQTHRPNELSGGEQQRVAVARALCNQPRLLLADEPSGNLDMSTAEALHHMLWDLCRRLRQTMIIVTHNRELAGRADRIIELSDGRIKTEVSNRRKIAEKRQERDHVV